MQPLALLHIALTCSFVLFLAYLLSTILSYLASSLLHGRPPSATSLSRKGSTSTRGLRRSTSPSTDTSEIAQELQEEDDEQDDDEEEDACKDTETRTASMRAPIIPPGSGFELADSIFQDEIAEDEDASRQEYSKLFKDAYEHKGEMGDAELIEKVKDHKGSFNGEDTVQNTGIDDEHGSDQTMGIDENGSPMEKKDIGQGANDSNDNIASGSNGKLGYSQGSTSLKQQRFPPTWSDLERMVNLSSKKLPSTTASAPSEAPLLEYDEL